PLDFIREHGTLDQHREKRDEGPTTKIRILVDRSVAKYIASGRKHYGFVSERTKGDWVEMTFLCREVEHGFARWYLMFADHAKILEPESMKQKVSDILKKSQEMISSQKGSKKKQMDLFAPEFDPTSNSLPK